MTVQDSTSSSSKALQDYSNDRDTPLNLLEYYLPLSLPTYNSIISPSEHLPVFGLDAGEVDDIRLFVIIADLGIQIRLFCSYEKLILDGRATEEGTKKAEQLVVDSVVGFFADRADKSLEMGLIGALNTIWLPCLEASPRIKIPFQSSYSIFLAPDTSKSRRQPRDLPDDLIASNAREEDITEILSTSEVAHSPSLI